MEPTTETSQGQETVDETVKRAKELNESVTAQQLAEDSVVPDISVPETETLPSSGIVDAVATDTQDIITADTQEARDLRKARGEFAQLAGAGSLADFQQEQLESFGVPDSTKQLKDIQLQLADIDESSKLTETRIEGAAGQTLGQAQREVTQEQRENAVRRSGLAAQASIIQGNIQTATTLVNQAVDTLYKDRTLTNSNLLNQINDLSGTVDNQTQQLLDKAKAEKEAEQAAIQEVKDAVNTAMESGAATPQEVAQLTDPTLTDEERLTLAQGISARSATEERRLDIREQEASIRASNALTNERYYNSLVTRAEAGDSAAISELGIVTDSVDNVGIYGELLNSEGGKPLPAQAVVSLEKAITVASQLNTLSGLFQDDKQLRGLVDPETGQEIGVDLAPITKVFRSNNPFDVKAQQITASINAIIPNLARGIYGEVGVLTDQDVARYAQTIPNLGSVSEVQDAMLALTLKTVQNSVKNKLVINARNGADVSQQVNTLEELERTVGQAMLPLNQKTPEYQALVSGGANPSEVDSLLSQGYDLEDVISYYTGQ